MELEYASPPNRRQIERVQLFLEGIGLHFDDNIEMTVSLLQNGEVVATGSRQGNVLKCIGISPSLRGEGLTSRIMTELINDAHKNRHSHLFLFTKPGNITIFSDFGFHLLCKTDDVAMLENRRDGIDKYIESLIYPHVSGSIGAVVANCNPFTNGHLYLIETAASKCDLLHLFILSEERSLFSAELRLKLAKEGTSHLKNVVVHPTGDYLISAATFPDYFIKDRARTSEINGKLDLTLFAERIAKPLGITQRFIGTEPFSSLTSAYHRQMMELLPRHGIDVFEIPRREYAGNAISASLVRSLLKERRFAEIKNLVPYKTMKALTEMYDEHR